MSDAASSGGDGRVRLLSYSVPCASCRYDLVGLPVEGVCPECSFSVRSSMVRHGGRRAVPVRRVDRAECVGCGYDLRGLPLDAVCPECATSIERSMRGDLLRNAPLAHLRRLSSAGSYMSALVWIVLVSWCFPPLGVIAASCWAVGWWGVLRPDPELRGNAPGERWRIVARLLVPAVLLAVLGALVAKSARQWGAVAGVPGGPGQSWADLAVAFALGVAVAQHESSLLFVRAFARRVPDRTLRARAGWLLWVGPIPAVIWLGREAATRLGIPPSVRLDGVTMPAAFILFLVWMFGYLGLTARLGAILAEEYVYADGLDQMAK
ncbi:MAG: hypothetical protein BroJett004_02060 [Planctomycetota bacterium]|nr:MAG: hypothetical protein BroJett004_02060 [Planctomycetota bacterium]